MSVPFDPGTFTVFVVGKNKSDVGGLEVPQRGKDVDLDGKQVRTAEFLACVGEMKWMIVLIFSRDSIRE